MSFPDNIDDVVSSYQEAMSFLANNTSRKITLFFEPEKSGCPNDAGYDAIERKAIPIYNSGNPFSQIIPTIIPTYGISGILNIPFFSGSCPVCQGNGLLFSPSSGQVSARIQWRNAETVRDYSTIKIDFEGADVRIKVTGIGDKHLMDKAKQVIIDGIICQKTKAGVPFGLRDIFEYHYYLNKLP